MVTYAELESRFAYLSEDFGKELAMKKFNLTEEQLENLVGRNAKGKRKGLLKGKIIWTKCIKGGWVRTGPYDWDAGQAHGYVAFPGHCQGFAIVDAWTGNPIYKNRVSSF